MCSSPSTPETVTYGSPAPEPEPAPVLKEPTKDQDTANIKANRRGTRALRTDLNIPETGGGGLSIPK